MNAHDGAGFAYLRRDPRCSGGRAVHQALELFPEHARSLVGLGAALDTAGDTAGAEDAFTRATTAIDALAPRRPRQRGLDGEAMCHAARGDASRALEALAALVDRPDMPFSGWTIPIEPLLEPLRKHPDYQRVTTRLAERAR